MINLIWIWLLKSVISQEVGQIGYFDKACPNGWEPFSDAKNRFILSDGELNIGQTGGEKKVKLKESEMPIHNHNNGAYNRLLTTTG